MTVVPMKRGWVLAKGLQGVCLPLLAMIVYAVGLQAALPGKFPWIVVGLLILVLITFVPPLVLSVVLLGRFGIAISADALAVGTTRGWKIMDTRALAGIGAPRSVAVMGVFGPTLVRRELLLVDSSGHRLGLPAEILTAPVRQVLRDHAHSGVVVTPLGRALLLTETAR